MQQHHGHDHESARRVLMSLSINSNNFFRIGTIFDLAFLYIWLDYNQVISQKKELCPLQNNNDPEFKKNLHPYHTTGKWIGIISIWHSSIWLADALIKSSHFTEKRMCPLQIIIIQNSKKSSPKSHYRKMDRDYLDLVFQYLIGWCLNLTKSFHRKKNVSIAK